MLRFNWLALLLVILLVAPGARADALDFSWFEAAATSLQPHQGASGHGGRLALSYALSNQAFMYVGGSQQDFDTERDRRYDFGVGINTDPAAGYVLYATVGWDHAGVDYPAAPGRLAHGFDAGVGVRTLLAEHWELYAGAHYAHNKVLAESTSGDIGIRYALSSRLSLGAGLDVDASQTAYLLSLRVYY
jgi:hypothetical protein